MMFLPAYEVHAITINDETIFLGVFKSKDEANDAALEYAGKELPERETLKAYQITEVCVNLTAMPDIF